MKSKYKVDIGQRFSRLVVLSEGNRTVPGRKVTFNCLCDCGNTVNVDMYSLLNGNTQSCKCLQHERSTISIKKRCITHGESWCRGKTPEYATWIKMKERCYWKKSNRFHRYGARGIVVCDRWLHSYENFLSDMGRKPTPKHSIDRINNDGIYEPSNCRWATSIEQARNKPSRIGVPRSQKSSAIMAELGIKTDDVVSATRV